MRRKKKNPPNRYNDPLFNTASVCVKSNSPHWYDFIVCFAVRLCEKKGTWHVFRYKRPQGRHVNAPFVDRRGPAFAQYAFAKAYAQKLFDRYLDRGAKVVRETKKVLLVNGITRSDLRMLLRKSEKVVKEFDSTMESIHDLANAFNDVDSDDGFVCDLENAVCDLEDQREAIEGERDSLVKCIETVRRKHGVR